MKKVLKISGVISLCIVVILLILIALNWENVVILYNGLTDAYTEKDIYELEQKNAEILNKVADVVEMPFNVLTDEEKAALREGKITESEAKEIVLGKKVYVDGKVVDIASLGQESSENSNDVTGESDDKKTEQDYDESAEIISEIYVLESAYKGKLRDIEISVISQYNALPEEEKTNLNKYKLGNEGVSKGLALKEECDGKMEVLLARLEKALKNKGKDTSIIEEIRRVYETEKTVTQSYYISKYKK